LAQPGSAVFRWVGSERAFLDQMDVRACGQVVLGRYGGHTGAGADKNEDGALIWCTETGNWEFAVLVDAHFSAESATLVLAALETERAALLTMLGQTPAALFSALHARLLAILMAPEFRAHCRQAVGEASCLICVRKAQFLWWMSIGDCVLYLFHPRLAALGQMALNQRSFYEWVGHENTFDLDVPCFATGTRQLLPGRNTVLLVTDGLLECGNRPFEDSLALYRLFAADTSHGPDLSEATRAALQRVHRERGRDSATLLAWRVEVKA
jgi:hypothetical protein